MQKLIAGYLFRHKKCALPGVGTLEIRNAESGSVAGEQMITPPTPGIHFTDKVSDAEGLALYIAANKNISHAEATYLLEKFSDDIRQSGSGQNTEIPGAGYFSKDADDAIIFIPAVLPAFFFPGVHAERVIHPDRSHAILVGDKETDSAAMTEFFAEEVPAGKRYWGIWAAVLFGIAGAAVGFYMNDVNRNSYFGVTHQYGIHTAGETYKNVP